MKINVDELNELRQIYLEKNLLKKTKSKLILKNFTNIDYMFEVTNTMKKEKCEIQDYIKKTNDRCEQLSIKYGKSLYTKLCNRIELDNFRQEEDVLLHLQSIRKAKREDEFKNLLGDEEFINFFFDFYGINLQDIKNLDDNHIRYFYGKLDDIKITIDSFRSTSKELSPVLQEIITPIQN